MINWKKIEPWIKPEWFLLAIIPFVMLVHALPHIPGDTAEGLEVYHELGSRAKDGLTGNDYPYPIHADEHIHLAWMSAIVRQGTVDFDDPYTEAPGELDLTTIPGLRSERGWNVAIVQFSLLTDMSLLTVTRFLPAIWSGFLAGTMYLALRDTKAAVPAALLVAILPTTVRSLGVGFLVPSAFGLPWVIATILVANRMEGGRRLGALAILLTGAHMMHLVNGVLAIAAAIAGTVTRQTTIGRRAVLLISTMIPLIWLVPTILGEAVSALSSEHTLPFEPLLFIGLGVPFYAAVAVGAALSLLQPTKENGPIRAMVVLAIPMAISIGLSAINDHRNDGTYTRQAFAMMLILIGPAAYGLTQGLHLATKIAWKKWVPAPSMHQMAVVIVAGLATAAYLTIPLTETLGEHGRYYRIHNDDSWIAAERLDELNPPQNAVFLSNSYLGPLYVAVSGMKPHAWATPQGPVNLGDWNYYQSSKGADEAWLNERNIDFIISTTPPNAPHDDLGDNIYRLK